MGEQPGQAAPEGPRRALDGQVHQGRAERERRTARRCVTTRVVCVTGDAVAMSEARCLWCQRPFAPRRGGSRQRFCCPVHRIQFHSAARLWAEQALASGALTIAGLQSVATRPSTLLPCRPGTTTRRFSSGCATRSINPHRAPRAVVEARMKVKRGPQWQVNTSHAAGWRPGARRSAKYDGQRPIAVAAATGMGRKVGCPCEV